MTASTTRAPQSAVRYSIDETVCINCGSCRRFCPVDCIPYQHLRHQVDQDTCIGCTICYAVCPVDAVVVDVPSAGSRVDLSTPAVSRVKEHALSRGPFHQMRRRAIRLEQCILKRGDLFRTWR